MATMIDQTIDQSRERIDEMRQTVTRRAEKLSRDAQTFVGRTKDTAVGTLLKTAAVSLETVAGLGRALPPTRPLADRLTSRASALDRARGALGKPTINGYDDMNVKQVGDALDRLPVWEVAKVRAYEEANKNRKTVLAACDRILDPTV